MSNRAWTAVFALVWLGLVVWACSPNPQPPGLTPVPTLGPGATATLLPALQTPPVPYTTVPAGGSEAALGVATYMEWCTRCHGLLGEGVDAPPLRNSQYIQTAGPAAIYATIAAGRPGTAMPAWLTDEGGPLNTSNIHNLVAYLATLQNVTPATPEPSPTPEPTETPPPPGAPQPTQEPARPSYPGGPGPAASIHGNPGAGKPEFGRYCSACHGPQGVLGLPNPDSDDEQVPELNPIDPTIASSDPAVFSSNADLFVEHGSIPSGPSPLIMMPPFGDSNMLSQTQIADIIAYVMFLNGVTWPK